MNRNAYVVINRSFGMGHDNETEIIKIFDDEANAKAYIDSQVLEWLKNQSLFDPKHKMSGNVEYGNGTAPYVMIDVFYDEEGNYSKYFVWDYEIYDLD